MYRHPAGHRRVIRRRSSQPKSKDTRRDGDAPAPFFNLTEEQVPEEGPLFNLEELHERRILSWSPEPDEFLDEPQAEVAPTRTELEERAREVYERPPAVETRVETAPIVAYATEAPVRVVTPPVEHAVQRPAALPELPAREVAPLVPQAPLEAAETVVADEQLVPLEVERAPRKRGRPRGRPRRQVHFHVDPDEERLLMAAVERYGSQQKGLIAALESLQEAELLRDEIERLREESERHRRLLEEAGALFKR
jgi:hypothetical protein